ncbi:MAG: hypothetical protein OXO54_06005 [Chloroflexota bacterium]|nr:hypothetical protein [Chloroflexota bacterium]
MQRPKHVLQALPPCRRRVEHGVVAACPHVGLKPIQDGPYGRDSRDLLWMGIHIDQITTQEVLHPES